MGRSHRLKDVAPLVAVALLYLVGGKLGLKLAFVNASASAVWPATGIAFVAFLLLGDRAWPAIFLGAFAVNLTTAGTVATSIGIAVGNTLEGLLGATLVSTADRALNAMKSHRGALDPPKN